MSERGCKICLTCSVCVAMFMRISGMTWITFKETENVAIRVWMDKDEQGPTFCEDSHNGKRQRNV